MATSTARTSSSLPTPSTSTNTNESYKFKRKKNYDTYKTFIQKLLHQEHPGGIGGGALDVVDSYVKLAHDRLIHKADLILRRSKKKTMSEGEIFSAVLLAFQDDDFSMQANAAGHQAVTTYVSLPSGDSDTRSSKSSKAGLIFPVSRVKERIKNTSSVEGLRVGEKTAVFLTGVLEFLTRALVREAGRVAIKHKHKRITPRDIKLAVLDDKSLQEITKGAFIPGGVQVDAKK